MRSKKILVPLALGSLIAVWAAVSALATHERPRIATPIRIPVVEAFKECTAPGAGNVHNAPAPFNKGACPAVLESNQVRYGHDPSATPTDRGAGFALIQVVPDNPSTATDETDVKLTGTSFDVTQPNGVTDYDPTPGSGGLGTDMVGDATIRITDHWNVNPSKPTCSSTQSCVATMTDTQFPVSVDCEATTFQGSTCSANTSANAVVPGVAVKGKFAVTEIGQIHFNDLATPTPNPAFRQGMFAP